MNPHQVDAALFAIRSPVSSGVVLADEVGLGKTIEASLVIAQKWAERKLFTCGAGISEKAMEPRAFGKIFTAKFHH